jgi:hypothetical protein
MGEPLNLMAEISMVEHDATEQLNPLWQGAGNL